MQPDKKGMHLSIVGRFNGIHMQILGREGHRSAWQVRVLFFSIENRSEVEMEEWRVKGTTEDSNEIKLDPTSQYQVSH